MPWTDCPLGQEAQVSTTTIFTVCWDEDTIVMHYWGKHLEYITNIASFSTTTCAPNDRSMTITRYTLEEMSGFKTTFQTVKNDRSKHY